jgi:hypothetical protein
MIESVVLTELIRNPAARRLWMLHNALQSLPFDRAIELACAAEAFVVGAEVQSELPAVGSEAALPRPDETPTDDHRVEIYGSPTPSAPVAIKRNGLRLPEEQRDRLLGRLAEGAKNTELATEFGLSSKQVQGLRIGSAREIATRRERLSARSARADESGSTASVEDVIRYLRQQDDVVVAQEDGAYLVNGRFRMSVAELFSRANRMRSRQGKPKLELPGTAQPSETVSSTNGHPLFWERAAAPFLHSGRSQKSD